MTYILVLIGAFLIAIATLKKSLFTVPDGEMKVIIRAGRIIKSVGSGLHSKAPMDYYHSVSTLTQEKRFSLVITKETVPIQIEGIVSYRVKDPAIYVKNYELGQKHLHKHPKTENQKLIQQLESRFKGSLTSIVGPIEIEEVIAGGISREAIKDYMNQSMSKFGIEIEEVNIEKNEPADEEFKATARKLIEWRAGSRYLEGLAKVAGKERIVDLLYLLKGPLPEGQVSPIAEKIKRKNLTDIEIEAFHKLKEAFGSDTAERIRKILALEHVFKSATPTMFLKEDLEPNGKNRINNLFE